MKTKIIYYLSVLVIISSCAQQKSKFPQGAWQLVHIQIISGDSVVAAYPGNYTGTDMKMWSDSNFIFVGKFKNDTTIINNYGGGKYKLEGNRYEEYILYHSNTGAVGSTVKMVMELRKDTLVQTWPVDEKGEVIKSNYYIEKYVRIK
jgi:hypothetical protein